MQLSRKADYALLAIRFLSRLPKGETRSINQISEGESIPREFSAKILKDLKLKGVIDSFQGVKGGYRLSRRPKNITYLKVIEAVDGPIHLNLCTEPYSTYCDRVGSCPLHTFWVKQESLLKRKLIGENFGNYAVKSRSFAE
jgi:Rrf2 family protein